MPVKVLDTENRSSSALVRSQESRWISDMMLMLWCLDSKSTLLPSFNQTYPIHALSAPHVAIYAPCPYPHPRPSPRVCPRARVWVLDILLTSPKNAFSASAPRLFTLVFTLQPMMTSLATLISALITRLPAALVPRFRMGTTASHNPPSIFPIPAPLWNPNPL